MNTKTLKKVGLRSLAAVLCGSMITSCAYEEYPSNYSSNGSRSYPTRSSGGNSAMPLLIGAAAIGAIALASSSRNKHNRYRSRHYNRHHNYGHNYGHRSSHYSRYGHSRSAHSSRHYQRYGHSRSSHYQRQNVHHTPHRSHSSRGSHGGSHSSGSHGRRGGSGSHSGGRHGNMHPGVI